VLPLHFNHNHISTRLQLLSLHRVVFHLQTTSTHPLEFLALLLQQEKPRTSVNNIFVSERTSSLQIQTEKIVSVSIFRNLYLYSRELIIIFAFHIQPRVCVTLLHLTNINLFEIISFEILVTHEEANIIRILFVIQIFSQLFSPQWTLVAPITIPNLIWSPPRASQPNKSRNLLVRPLNARDEIQNAVAVIRNKSHPLYSLLLLSYLFLL
jgi:hypothetical protein